MKKNKGKNKLTNGKFAGIKKLPTTVKGKKLSPIPKGGMNPGSKAGKPMMDKKDAMGMGKMPKSVKAAKKFLKKKKK